jgi:hypothetical protein
VVDMHGITFRGGGRIGTETHCKHTGDDTWPGQTGSATLVPLIGLAAGRPLHALRECAAQMARAIA